MHINREKLQNLIGYLWLAALFSALVYFATQARNERIDKEGVIQDKINLLINIAEQGDIDAQYKLARLYSNNDSFSLRDSKKAWHWGKKASDGGHSKAPALLGTFYANEFGVKRQHNKMISFYRLSAQRGNADGQYLLASHLLSTGHIGNNESEAVKWYTLAAIQGHPVAQFHLGAYIYYPGRGVNKDIFKARKWVSEAVNNIPDWQLAHDFLEDINTEISQQHVK